MLGIFSRGGKGTTSKNNDKGESATVEALQLLREQYENSLAVKLRRANEYYEVECNRLEMDISRKKQGIKDKEGILENLLKGMPNEISLAARVKNEISNDQIVLRDLELDLMQKRRNIAENKKMLEN